MGIITDRLGGLLQTPEGHSRKLAAFFFELEGKAKAGCGFQTCCVPWRGPPRNLALPQALCVTRGWSPQCWTRLPDGGTPVGMPGSDAPDSLPLRPAYPRFRGLP